MKIIIALLSLALPLTAMASENDLRFTEDYKEGESVFDSYLGDYEMCFTGNPYAVRNKTLKFMDEDIEKMDSFIGVDKRKDTLIISYVDTKCLDDSLDATPSSCRVTWLVPRCE